jgi:hypothetical protein
VGFIKAHRKLQRYRRAFSCRVTDGEAAGDLRTFLARARRIFAKALDEAAEGRWYSKEEVGQRKKLYREVKASFEVNGLPTGSAVSQIFSALDRGVKIEEVPLVYANPAKSLATQAEVEVFARDGEIGLKAGAAKSKVYPVPVTETPPEGWFIQYVEIHEAEKGGVELILVVVRSREGVEKVADTKRGKTREEALRDTSKVPFVIAGAIYLVEREAADKINARIGKDIPREKLASLTAWIVNNGERIPATRIG